MTTLHTFGCSITQGFALPDVVRTICDDSGRPLTDQEVRDRNIHWSDIHIYEPSKFAWPQVLADQLNIPVVNHARRGACFQQISRQCAVAAPTIQPTDIIIVMWTYLSRLSLQWPARTAVPFATIADPKWNLRTVILGFNKFFGLERGTNRHYEQDDHILNYIHDSTQYHLNPMGTYNRYYNSLVLQTMTDGFLKSTGARVIHLSVETDTAISQLHQARMDLDPSLREPYVIPNPQSWYTLSVDHNSCRVILDPTIPLAPNDMHPSVQHHANFAEHIHSVYFT
jgi:hypothetical protein